MPNKQSGADAKKKTGLRTTKIESFNHLENTQSNQTVGIEDREAYREMVATAAYYRAEKRGFNGGDATQDWLEAEAEINHIHHN